MFLFSTLPIGNEPEKQQQHKKDTEKTLIRLYSANDRRVIYSTIE